MNIHNFTSNKKLTGTINRALEMLVPPIISDRKLVACLFNFIQGRGFRFIDVTADPATFPRGKRDTDCTRDQWRAALRRIEGPSVLDIGCGTGTFVRRLAEEGLMATGIDPGAQPREGKNWRIIKAYPEKAGFPEQAFDTVLSFKTLEHIPDARSALGVWRTFAKRRVILIVPCQRYRRFGYDGHVNFYPDEYQLRIQLGLKENASISKVDHEWFISEDIR